MGLEKIYYYLIIMVNIIAGFVFLVLKHSPDILHLILSSFSEEGKSCISKFCCATEPIFIS